MTDEAPTAAKVEALIARKPVIGSHSHYLLGWCNEAAAALAAQRVRIAELTAELEGCEIAHRAAGNDALRLTRERNEARRLFEDADARLDKAEAALAERDKLLLDVAASLAAAVNLLEYSCDCKDRLLDQRLKDYAASVERVRAYYAAIATAKAGQHGN